MTSLLQVRQAANILGVHENTLRRWEAEGLVKAVRLPSGVRRFVASDVDRLRAEIYDSPAYADVQNQLITDVLETESASGSTTTSRSAGQVPARGIARRASSRRGARRAATSKSGARVAAAKKAPTTTAKSAASSSSSSRSASRSAKTAKTATTSASRTAGRTLPKAKSATAKKGASKTRSSNTRSARSASPQAKGRSKQR